MKPMQRKPRLSLGIHQQVLIQKHQLQSQHQGKIVDILINFEVNKIEFEGNSRIPVLEGYSNNSSADCSHLFLRIC